MSVYSGPEINQSGLVFSYDMGNTNKSWKGEPSTNILPSPQNNGRFTTLNGWGTFNGNQYNNGNYFSIGTIASITNNIVTTTTAHPLRTFDAVTPQTTGGGVTAGAFYFIKKISATQFSLHSYNNTENGSQGFINPATGFHKVHDSIALDQRIEINSTGFPTMWWGSAHIPNSAIVKQVLDGAGPEGQSVMRLHIHRTDGIVDGMAYGVYTPVTTGNVINVSYWARTSYPGKSMLYTTYFGSGVSAYNSQPTLTADWVRIKHQWTSPATFSFYQYWFPNGSTDVPYWIDICDLQVEVNTQSGSTPFVAGTRSNTQALADQTNNNTITLDSVTYNADGSFEFDGINNYASFGNASALNSIGGTSAITVEAWVYYDTYLGNNGAQSYSVVTHKGYPWTWLMENPGNTGRIRFVIGGSDVACPDTETHPLSTWMQWVGTYDGSNMKFYRNGVLKRTTAATGVLGSNNGSAIIGEYAGSYRINGKINAIRIYNKALTEEQVLQNFNALRGRFGI